MSLNNSSLKASQSVLRNVKYCFCFYACHLQNIDSNLSKVSEI